jgi:hypothetical protein
MAIDMKQLEGMNREELLKRLIMLENQPKRTATLSLKVGAKGGVSLYGTGKFPVTLYPETWIKVLEQAEAIRQFISDNRDNGLQFKNGIPAMDIPAGHGVRQA